MAERFHEQALQVRGGRVADRRVPALLSGGDARVLRRR
nr:MAG TPA: hypothetical protein [Caudoviricetes sp.]